MFKILLEEKWITIVMFLLMAGSLFARIFLGGMYSAMIRETDNMAGTENKVLKQCKLKFANCYRMNGSVANVNVFVEKFLQRLSLGPISFDGLYRISSQLMLLSVGFAGFGACREIGKGKSISAVLPFYIAAFVGLYLFFSLSGALDLKGRKQVLKVSLIDYLENHFLVRLKNTEQDLDFLSTPEKKGDPEGIKDPLPVAERKEIMRESVDNTMVTKEELEELLESLLAP